MKKRNLCKFKLVRCCISWRRYLLADLVKTVVYSVTLVIVIKLVMKSNQENEDEINFKLMARMANQNPEAMYQNYEETTEELETHTMENISQPQSDQKMVDTKILDQSISKQLQPNFEKPFYRQQVESDQDLSNPKNISVYLDASDPEVQKVKGLHLWSVRNHGNFDDSEGRSENQDYSSLRESATESSVQKIINQKIADSVKQVKIDKILSSASVSQNDESSPDQLWLNDLKVLELGEDNDSDEYDTISEIEQLEDAIQKEKENLMLKHENRLEKMQRESFMAVNGEILVTPTSASLEKLEDENIKIFEDVAYDFELKKHKNETTVDPEWEDEMAILDVNLDLDHEGKNDY